MSMIMNSTCDCFYMSPSLQRKRPICLWISGYWHSTAFLLFPVSWCKFVWVADVTWRSSSAKGSRVSAGLVEAGCAHVQFNLGWAYAQRCCDWHPQVPPVKSGNWNSLLGLLQAINPGKQTSLLEWEECLQHVKSFPWVSMVPLPLTLHFILQTDEKWQERLLLDT